MKEFLRWMLEHSEVIIQSEQEAHKTVKCFWRSEVSITCDRILIRN